jgi:hypothetical protein
MRRRRTYWGPRRAVLLLSTGVLAASTLPGSAAAVGTGSSICGVVHGAHYSFTPPGSHQRLSDSRYRVLAGGTSCSLAKASAAHLTYATPGARQPDGGRLLKGGPAGWKCEGKSYTYARRKPPTISGMCYQGQLTNPTRYFHWGIYGA